MSRTKEYTPPEETNLSGEEIIEDVKETSTVKETPYKLPGQTIPAQIGINSLVNAKATAVTDVLISRVQRHLTFTVGSTGFSSAEQRAEEQGGFINTVLGSLELDFDKFVLVTDFIISQLRENAEGISNGQMLKHIKGLSANYDKTKVDKYVTYIAFLSRIALNWNIRYKLNSLIDINLFVSKYSPKAQNNINQYFHHLQNV